MMNSIKSLRILTNRSINNSTSIFKSRSFVTARNQSSRKNFVLTTPRNILNQNFSVSNTVLFVSPSSGNTITSMTSLFHTTSSLWQQEQQQNNGNNGNKQSEEQQQQQQNQAADQQNQPEQPKPSEQQQQQQQQQQPQQQASEEKIKALENRVQDLLKKLQYSYAEFDNLQRAKNEEIERTRQYALQEFSKGLLDVVDNLERCLSSVKKTEIPEDAKQLRLLYEAVEMTNSQFFKVLNKNHVSPLIPKVGDKFNPDQMEALMTIENPQLPSDTVGLVLRRGFVLKERVLRAAQVAVVKTNE